MKLREGQVGNMEGIVSWKYVDMNIFQCMSV